MIDFDEYLPLRFNNNPELVELNIYFELVILVCTTLLLEDNAISLAGDHVIWGGN